MLAATNRSIRTADEQTHRAPSYNYCTPASRRRSPSFVLASTRRLPSLSSSDRESYRARTIPKHRAVFRPMSRLAAYRLRPGIRKILDIRRFKPTSRKTAIPLLLSILSFTLLRLPFSSSSSSSSFLSFLRMYINVHVFTIRCSISTRRRRLYINTPDQARDTASRFFAGRAPTAISIPFFNCLASLLPPLHFVITFLSHPTPTTIFPIRLCYASKLYIVRV